MRGAIARRAYLEVRTGLGGSLRVGVWPRTARAAKQSKISQTPLSAFPCRLGTVGEGSNHCFFALGNFCFYCRSFWLHTFSAFSSQLGNGAGAFAGAVSRASRRAAHSAGEEFDHGIILAAPDDFVNSASK